MVKSNTWEYNNAMLPINLPRRVNHALGVRVVYLKIINFAFFRVGSAAVCLLANPKLVAF